MEVSVYTFINKETNALEVEFYSSECGPNQSSELRAGINSNKFIVYHPEAYYDDGLRAKRNTLNMISALKPKERLSLLGQVWGCRPITDKKRILLGQSSIEAVLYGT